MPMKSDLDDRVIRILARNKGQHVTQDQMAAITGKTKSAVCKAVERLVSAGVPIEHSRSSRGVISGFTLRASVPSPQTVLGT